MEKQDLGRIARLIKPYQVDRCWQQIEKVVSQYGLELFDDSMTNGGFYLVHCKDEFPGTRYIPKYHGDEGVTEFKQFRNYCGADYSTYEQDILEVEGYEFMIWGKITKRQRKCLEAIIQITEKRYGISINIDIF